MNAARRRYRLIRRGRRILRLLLALAAVTVLFSVANGGLASAAPTPRLGRVAEAAAQRADASDGGATTAAAGRPDFRATFVRVDAGQAGRPFAYIVQVRNDGTTGGSVRVTTVLPLSFTNVRVHAPGFACSRQLTPSGPDAGTVVSCTRNDLAVGMASDVTVEANAPTEPGTYRLVATADPRGEIAEADEANNQVSATVDVGT
jgi:hypothetical protein